MTEDANNKVKDVAATQPLDPRFFGCSYMQLCVASAAAMTSKVHLLYTMDTAAVRYRLTTYHYCSLVDSNFNIALSISTKTIIRCVLSFGGCGCLQWLAHVASNILLRLTLGGCLLHCDFSFVLSR